MFTTVYITGGYFIYTTMRLDSQVQRPAWSEETNISRNGTLKFKYMVSYCAYINVNLRNEKKKSIVLHDILMDSLQLIFNLSGAKSLLFNNIDDSAINWIVLITTSHTLSDESVMATFALLA